MGVKKGTLSYTLYQVDGELPTGFQHTFLERIAAAGFTELSLDSERDFSVGWVVCDELLNTTFASDRVFHDEYILLSMRVDRWALPGALVRARTREREEQVLRAQGRMRLTRAERDQIRLEITRDMKRQTLPAASMVDMAWSTRAGRVRFWSHSKTANERFDELFESTFELRLRPIGPWVAALSCGLGEEHVALLDDLEPADFHGEQT